jgi:hypothetical protein
MGALKFSNPGADFNIKIVPRLAAFVVTTERVKRVRRVMNQWGASCFFDVAGHVVAPSVALTERAGVIVDNPITQLPCQSRNSNAGSG